jgi:hypothetical protein
MYRIKSLIIAFLILLTASFAFSELSENQARDVAYKTWSALRNINMVLVKIKKKDDITQAAKESLSFEVSKLKEIKKEVAKIKTSASEADIKLLNSHFNTGPYSVALKKAVRELFLNLSRIKKIDGGEKIASLLVY